MIVEPTSGNTGIALAFACAVKGYRLTMPKSMSTERRKMLSLLGTEIDLTSAHQGMRGAIARADAIVAELGDAVIPQQLSNVAKPEIWRDTNGVLDVMLADIVTGCAGLIKEQNPDFQMIAVEPEDSAVLPCGGPGTHRIEGIGTRFFSENLDTILIVIPSFAERHLSTPLFEGD